MAVNDTALLEVIGTVGGQQHIHTLHFRYGDPASSEQGLIDAWQANARTSYRSMFATVDSPVQLLRARQVCGSLPLRAPVEEAEILANQAGTFTQSGHASPTWLAALTNHRTAFAGPSRRGRSFFGGLYETWVNANNLESGWITQIQVYWTAFDGAFGVGGSTTYDFVIHSHKLAQPGVQCTDSSTIVTSHQIVTAVASMKSRKPGSGN